MKKRIKIYILLWLSLSAFIGEINSKPFTNNVVISGRIPADIPDQEITVNLYKYYFESRDYVYAENLSAPLWGLKRTVLK